MTTVEQFPSVIYRQLWKTDLGDQSAVVRVHRDGRQEIEDEPDLKPSDVGSFLADRGLRFVRLLRCD